MSCQEWSCTDCDYVKFDNSPRPPCICPECGGVEFVGCFDESGEHGEPEPEGDYEA